MKAGVLCAVVIMLSAVSLSAHQDNTGSKGELLDNGEHVHTKREIHWVTKLKRYYACEDASVTLECPYRSEIVVMEGDYGIRKPERVNDCRRNSSPKEMCLTSAVATMQALCNHQQKCGFTVENKIFPTDPCVGYWKELNVGFRCKRMQDGPIKAYACGHYQLDLQCPWGQQITMVSANWGRRSHSTCNPWMLNLNMTYFRDELGCSKDVLGIMAERCDGYNWCSTKAEDGPLGGDPCWRVYKQLVVTYNCN